VLIDRSQEADAAKAAGKHDINMGRLPLLEVDGAQIAQSKTIDRFIAKKCGFLGASDIEAAQIDALCEHVRDIKDAYQKVRALPDEAKPAGMEKYFGTDLPEWCGKLEKAIALTSKTPGCAVGDKLSMADLTIYYWLTFFFDNTEGAKAAFAPCPTISAIVSTVGANEAVKAWEAKRPVTKI